VVLGALRGDLAYLPDRARGQAVVDAERFERPYITRCLEVIGETLVDMRQAPDPRVGLDVALVRLTNVEADTSLAALVERVSRLERAGGGGAGGAGGADAASGAGAGGASGGDRPAGTTGSRSAPEASPPPMNPSPARPADAARRVLADQPSSERPALGGVRAAGPPIARPPEVASAPPAPPSDTTAAAGMPTRDDLTLAWGDAVLGRLAQPVRVRWGTGRFVGVDGDVARFALPNAIHRDRCEEQRPEVERVLTEHFGRPVRLELTLDGEQAGAMPGPVPTLPAPAEIGEIDLSELVDAPADPRRGLDVLSEHFPDAQLFEEEDDT